MISKISWRLRLALLALSTFNPQLSTALAQGNLTPPDAPMPTMKSLDQLDAKLEKRIAITNLPCFIGDSGSYYLASSLTGLAGFHGIDIFGADVTLDLNGFTLVGINNSLGGVRVGGGFRNVVIRNGSITGWGTEGVSSFDALSTIRLENLRIHNNGSGIKLFSRSVIADCIVTANSTNGIFTFDGCVVTRCTVSANGSTGVTMGNDCRITDCLVKDNTAHGISIGFNGTVRDCTVTGNTQDGIRTATRCRVDHNLCTGNGNGGDGAGIHVVGNECRIEENQVQGNDRGIDVDFGQNIILKNTASGNSTNYDIGVGNAYGPIVAAADNIATLTNGANPWANFTH